MSDLLDKVAKALLEKIQADFEKSGIPLPDMSVSQLYGLAKVAIDAMQDTMIQKLWMNVSESIPSSDYLCDIRYQDGTTSYGTYDDDIGWVSTDQKFEVITHWKPAPRDAS